MATYKVLQDIEAEDKLLGPLSLRQFVYAGVAALSLYLCYFFLTHGLAPVVAIFLPFALVSGFFAFPWGRDQPTEVWALAKIRFLLKPRKRVWNQSGVKELVTITVPKQIVTNYSNGLTPEQVRSRLQALASTIDTRGWAVKNANLNVGTIPPVTDMSDRLLAPTTLPKPVENTDVQASDDILDERNNAGAQRLQTMINKSSEEHRSKLIENLQKPASPKPADYWFLNQPSAPATVPSNMVTFNTQVVTPGTHTNNDSGLPTAPLPDEASIVAELKEHEMQSELGAYRGHMHTIQPLSYQTTHPQQPNPAPTTPAPPQPQVAPPQAQQPTGQTQNASAPVTPAGQAAILQLASNDDLDVATIAREAERAVPQNEVVIKLH